MFHPSVFLVSACRNGRKKNDLGGLVQHYLERLGFFGIISMVFRPFHWPSSYA